VQSGRNSGPTIGGGKVRVRTKVRERWTELRVSVLRGMVEQYTSVKWGMRVREGVSESK
jgi:hypothetical protein